MNYTFSSAEVAIILTKHLIARDKLESKGMGFQPHLRVEITPDTLKFVMRLEEV